MVLDVLYGGKNIISATFKKAQQGILQLVIIISSPGLDDKGNYLGSLPSVLP